MSFFIFQHGENKNQSDYTYIENTTNISGKPLYKCPGKIVQKNNDICAICQSKFKKGKSCKELDCHHIYHTKCIEEWRNTCLFWDIKVTCPSCKKIIN